jgi:diguanylate cyclase (GGDEF)-like protein/PAS domain S-box-containing protein
MHIQAEANLSALIESTEDLIWSVDLDDRLIAFNSALQRHLETTFGIRPAVGMLPRELVPPWRINLPPQYERARVEGAIRVEFSLADGRVLDLALSPILVDGEVTGVSIFGKDITKRKAAERAALEAERKYREIFDGALEGIFQTSPEGKLLTANPALATMLGYESAEELVTIAEDVVEVIWAVPEQRSDFLRQLEVSGASVGFECQLKHKGGGNIWASLNARRVCGSDGQLLNYEGFLIDITERKRMELAQREDLDLLRETQLVGALGSYVLDVATGMWTSSEALDKFFGIGKDYVRSVAGWAALIHPDDRAMMTAYFTDEVLSRGRTFDKEYRIVRQTDGAEFWVHGMGRLDFDAHGKPLKMRGIIKDITERKQAEMQLRDSEERYRSTFEQAAVGIVHASFEGKILRSNPHFAEMVGYSAEELIGLEVQQITLPEDGPASKDALERVLREGVPVSIEKRYLRKDGSPTWVKLTISIQRDGDGHPQYFIGLIEDINDRKAAEERLSAAANALRLSEVRYRTAFQTSLDSININRLSDGTYIDVNQAFLDVTGFKREEVIGKTSLELEIWADTRDRQKLTEPLRLNSVVRNLEAHFRKKNGTLLWGLMSAAVIELDGVPCILSITRDITEAKAAEERLASAASELRLSEERYRTVFLTCPDSVQISRMSSGVILDVNQAFLDATGFERNEVLGHTSEELGIWANDCERQSFVDAVSRGDSIRDMEVRSRRKNGEIFWIRLSACMIEIDGEPCRLTFAKEITEVKAAEERLASATEALLASEERYRTVFHTSLDCITLSHLSDGRYIDVNKAFLDLIGIEPEEIVGRTSTDLGIWAYPETRAEIAEMLRRDQNVRDFQTQFVKKSGEKIWVLISATIIEIGGISCIVSVVRDISGAKAAESTIHSLALFDPLTGLPNRRLLFERLSQTLADRDQRGRLKALLLVDVDNLKTLNDTLGHHIGDLLLQEVARRIASCAHEPNTVGRLGGDEFVVILSDLSEVPEEAATQAKAFGQEILDSISQPYLLEDRECLTAASMGVTIFGDKENTADEILQKADIALHLAKADGRNTLRFFSPALQAIVNAQAVLEKDLRLAIKTKQFVLYYQPQVERGRMTGAEALIRWIHPSRGIVPPDEFIPIAEESRLILPMGDWVLETACRQIASWAARPETARLTIAVNISALQFRQPEFVDRVLAALDHTGANPKCLKLELTESMLVENIEDVIAKMTELKSHGLSFSLDDFGTGYSSLAYLKRLPLDQLKIDRSFVRDMLVDLTSGAIAQTIISLGRAMELSVVAEGVETEEQRGFLAGLGCHCFQGDLFSRPLPPDEFEALL